jgi:hypothetical protein
MASINLPKVFLLLLMPFMITSVSATKQYALKEDDAALNSPYYCLEPITTYPTYPLCCPNCTNSALELLCPGNRPYLFKTSNATKLLGTIDIILEGNKHKTVQALVDLTTRRNFITSTLVEDLGLGRNVSKLTETDIHSIEIDGRNITITEFVLLTICTGIDDSCLRDKVFEVVLLQRSEDEELVLSNLVLCLNFLYTGDQSSNLH